MSLLDARDVAPYYRTPFIEHGYRPPMSPRDSWWTFFSMHNETLNMWTHAFGTLLFVVFVFLEVFSFIFDWHTFLSALPGGATFVVLFMPLGASLTCAFSTMYHTMGCVSEHMYQNGMKLDGCGILSSAYPPQVVMILFAWYCFPAGNFAWLLLLTLLLGTTLVMTQHAHFSTFAFRKIRVVAFGSYAFFWMPSLFVLWWSRGSAIPTQLWQMPAHAAISGTIIYAIGTVLVVFRIPERWARGRLSIIWSHPVWHCCTVTGAFLHYWLLRQFVVWFFSQSNICGTNSFGK